MRPRRYPPRLQEWLKLSENLQDISGAPIETWDQFPKPWEQYRRGHFACRPGLAWHACGRSHPHNYCVTFESVARFPEINELPDVPSYLVGIRARQYRSNQAVFVVLGDISQKGERVDVRSRVSVRPLDSGTRQTL